jgi:hypothetical protein
MLQLQKAQRSKAYLKLGMSAPSGGGKTLGALLIAYGLAKEMFPNQPDDVIWSKIAIVDTENGSGQLYVGTVHQNTKIGEYNVVPLPPPFSVDKYIQALSLCEQYEMAVCIIDSTTHAWSGEGGLLEEQQNIAKRIGNSYAAWRDITPKHNDFVSKMLQAPMHIIATMRSKQEYVQEQNNGKTTIRKVGLEPEQRKGMEYEFTAFFEVDVDHKAFGSKDRTSMYDQKTFVITPDVGIKYMKWLNEGVDTKAEVLGMTEASPEDAMESVKQDVFDLLKKLGGSGNEMAVALVKEHHASGNPNAIKDIQKMSQLRSELKDLLEQTQNETV